MNNNKYFIYYIIISLYNKYVRYYKKKNRKIS